MSRGSGALFELLEGIRRREPGAPVTWGELAEVVKDAAESLSSLEYEDYMGEDL